MPAVVVDWLVPPVEGRRWKDAPFAGVMTVIACLEPASRVSRSITPALAQALVFSMEATRATIWPSPVRGW